MQDLLIRAELPADVPAISRVVGAAFNRESEANLVTLIRARGESLISLVAVSGDVVVGHVLVSPVTLDAPGTFGGVAPLSVLPPYQGKGVGSKLMTNLLVKARELGLDALFLLGDPAYYRRFGFQTSHIANEYGATDAFQHLELVPGSLTNVPGLARYVQAFSEESV